MQPSFVSVTTPSATGKSYYYNNIILPKFIVFNHAGMTRIRWESIFSNAWRRQRWSLSHQRLFGPSDLLQQNECSFTVTAAYQRMVRSRWHSAQDAKSGTTRPVKLSLTLFFIVTTKRAGFVIIVQYNLFSLCMHSCLPLKYQKFSFWSSHNVSYGCHSYD